MATKILKSSLIRDIKKSGIGVIDSTLQRQIVGWVSEFAAFRGSISDVNVILFNPHTEELARRLLAHKVKKVTMIEGCRSKNQLHQEAIKELEKSLAPGQEIHALNVPMDTVMIPSKTRPVVNAFWEGLHDIGGVVAASYEDKKSNFYRKLPPKHSTVMIGMLPFPIHQRALLQALLNQMLIYYSTEPVFRPKRSKRGETSSSFFEFGHFSLITFLRMNELARLMSAKVHMKTPTVFNEELKFFTTPHRHFSYLFHTLFDVKLPACLEPFPDNFFDPVFPSAPPSTHDVKCEILGLKKDAVYAVQIEPKLEVCLPGGLNIPFTPVVPLDKEHLALREFIVDFAGWMTMTGKLRRTLSLHTAIEELIGAHVDRQCLYDAQISSKDCVRDVTSAQFGELFSLVRNDNNEKVTDLNKKMTSFKHDLLQRDKTFVD